MLEQLKEVLRGLKWTDSQVSVYCTLVEKGAMKPADLSLHANVAQGKIYTVLEELEKTKGVIFKSKSSHKLYDAHNPRYVLEQIMSDLHEKVDDALIDAEQIYEKRSEQIVGKLNCYTIQSISGVKTSLRELISSCKKSLKFHDNDLRWIGTDERKMIARLIRDQKKVKIISTKAFKNILEELSLSKVDVKLNEKNNSFYIFDDEIALIRFSSPDSAVVIKEKSFVSDWINKFNDSEKQSKPFKIDEQI
ncbi:MAG: helix-turn-helix domain-containing protein [Candidatus Nitrosotenuis sp.]